MHYFDRQARKARKRYECSLCLAPIRPGQTYDVQASVDHGDWEQWREHQGCLELYYEVSGASEQDEIPHAALWDTLNDLPDEDVAHERHTAIIGEVPA